MDVAFVCYMELKIVPFGCFHFTILDSFLLATPIPQALLYGWRIGGGGEPRGGGQSSVWRIACKHLFSFPRYNTSNN